MEVNTFTLNRIIIFRQSRIGDTLVTFPLIDALHRLYPDSSLIYCTQNFRSDTHLQGHNVAKLNPYIKGIVTYDFEDSARSKFLKLKKKLKISKNDLLIYLPYSTVQRYQVIRDWIFFKVLGFKNMICFKETWNWTYLYEQNTSELPNESTRMLNFVRSAGIPVEFSGICSLNYDKNWAEQKWSEWGLNRKEVLAVCPGSKMQSKRWSIERYIKVGKEWHKRTGMSLVIIGGPAEAETANEIINHWPGYGFSTIGANLGQTAGVLRKVRAYCGNDTGGMHLAAILGIPCVAIFSSRAPDKLWHPFGENNIVLKEDVDCKNCNLENCYTNPSLCLDKISIERVLDALSKICKGQNETKSILAP